MLAMIESLLVNRVLYQSWFPQVYVDQHHMGNSDARIFIGEMYEPLNPRIDPLTVTNVHLVGAAMRGRMESEGKPGVIHRANWDGFWQGGFFTNAWWHNVVGILTEVAATRMATSVFQSPNSLDGSYFSGVASARTEIGKTGTTRIRGKAAGGGRATRSNTTSVRRWARSKSVRTIEKNFWATFTNPLGETSNLDAISRRTRSPFRSINTICRPP
jgi:hypothetical protein